MTTIDPAPTPRLLSAHRPPLGTSAYPDNDVMGVKVPCHRLDATDHDNRDAVTLRAGGSVIVPAGQTRHAFAEEGGKTLRIAPKEHPGTADADRIPAPKPQN